MNTITNKDVVGMVKRLQTAMHATNLLAPTDVLAVETGSKTNGNSWKVVRYDATGYRSSSFGSFHYGMTARDCYDRVHAMCVALEEVAYCARHGVQS